MRSLLLALAVMWLATPALASDMNDVQAVAKQYNDNFNKGDTKAAVALCTSNTMIIDDFAPHAWNTCADWFAALTTYDKSAGITNGTVAMGKPWHVAVTGDRAYAVYPTHYTYKRNGKKVTEQGVWTFAMQKTEAGWRIAGWAWAQH